MLAAPHAAWAGSPGDTARPAASATAHVITETSQVLPRWTPSAGVVTQYGQDLTRDATNEVIIRRRTITSLTFALSLFDRAEVLADLPMVLHQQGTATDDTGDPATASSLQASALGDLRVGLKGTILKTPRRGFGLGVLVDVIAPTGDRSAWAGSGGVQMSARLLAEQTMARGITVAANAGYLLRPDLRIGELVIGDAVTLATALRIPLDRRQIVAAVGEVEGSIGIPAGSRHPVVLRAGLRARLRSGMVLGLYAGGAPAPAVGVPQVHAILAIHWAPAARLRSERPFDRTRPAHATEIARRRDERRLATIAPTKKLTDPADPDGDGLLAAMDQCPNVAEDNDGFEDDDGCPDLDNDHDGLRDALDHCPNVPELVNGALDWDGCPDMIVDGEVIPLRRLDPAQLIPAVRFARGSAELGEDTVEAITAFAELMQLNPWLGTLSLRVYVQPSNSPAVDRGLADKRAQALIGLLAARGVDPKRVRVETPRTVDAKITERARLAWANDPGAAIGGP
ncbi:MAG: hypothetical protein JKY37_23410, partial [Nannocystaceae bacterium]|nr:hypothetical protein [Nannocystaceae bacterium]